MSEFSKTAVNGVTYHSVWQGSVNASPLLLLHGFTGSAANWEPHLPLFSDQFSVISVDILGHGRTDSPSNPSHYTMPQVAADIIALLDGWRIKQTALLGYSMGGRLALYLACHYPDRFSHLILESSSPGLPTAAERAARRQNDESLANWIEANGIPAFVDKWESLPLWHSQQQLPEAVRQQLRRQRLQNSSVGLANSLRGMGTGAQPSLWPQLGALTLPTLLIVGDLDTKFVTINEKMEVQLPNGRLHIIPRAGHITHLERPELFRTAVLRFLGNWVIK